VRFEPSWRRFSVAWPTPPPPRSIESAIVPEEISAGIWRSAAVASVPPKFWIASALTVLIGSGAVALGSRAMREPVTMICCGSSAAASYSFAMLSCALAAVGTKPATSRAAASAGSEAD
jgi:hypothetical protein